MHTSSPSVSAQTKGSASSIKLPSCSLDCSSALWENRYANIPPLISSTGNSRTLALSQHPAVKIATSFRLWLYLVPTASLVCAILVGSSATCLAIRVLVWELVRQSSDLHHFLGSARPSAAVTAAWWSFGCPTQLWYHRTSARAELQLRAAMPKHERHIFLVSVWFLSTFDAQFSLTDFAASQAVPSPGTRSVVAPTSCSSVPKAQQRHPRQLRQCRNVHEGDEHETLDPPRDFARPESSALPPSSACHCRSPENFCNVVPVGFQVRTEQPRLRPDHTSKPSLLVCQSLGSRTRSLSPHRNDVCCLARVKNECALDNMNTTSATDGGAVKS